ncbi:hypothetical protein BDZ89DRAFT_1165183 [Hymenopellis radicata]|nr:hypothetical protein BDZ89DRAFT_1165183 [Hymenopellis radicata]
MASTTVLAPRTVLGKRKADELVLRLASSPEPTESDADYIHEATTSKHIIVNGELVIDTKKRYKCTFAGCDKAYTKPSRLEEHERTHTGLRPFVCSTCNKSYLRETHLHAHVRSHLPESERPLACDRPNCKKRFWTKQHLKVHLSWHDGSKVFACAEPGCSSAFSKHHQLRAHICDEHAPPGTKPFPCPHTGCSKSFSTNQHLKTHSKTHSERRYTCVHLNCVAEIDSSPVFYSTWSALQHHIRTAHPPTCPHPSCHGKTFTTQKGLRAHEKIHAERDIEAALDSGPPRKKRRGGELGRDWVCDVEGCSKDFKSKKALNTHVNITHLGRRDHVCPHEDCQRAFGYKHLLQRHIAKAHATAATEYEDDGYDEASSESSADEAQDQSQDGFDFDLDNITGNRYKQHANQKLASSAKMLRCPYPCLPFVHDTLEIDTQCCDYVFSRAYDLRRHLQSMHDVVTEKAVVEEWVAKHKAGEC